jgi:hypothetical protein
MGEIAEVKIEAVGPNSLTGVVLATKQEAAA